MLYKLQLQVIVSLELVLRQNVVVEVEHTQPPFQRENEVLSLLKREVIETVAAFAEIQEHL